MATAAAKWPRGRPEEGGRTDGRRGLLSCRSLCPMQRRFCVQRRRRAALERAEKRCVLSLADVQGTARSPYNDGLSDSSRSSCGHEGVKCDDGFGLEGGVEAEMIS